MKKETVEEAAERIYPTPNPYIMGIDLGNSMRREAFKEGAKWQQERMYSEEEVLDMMFELLNQKKEECCITNTRDSIVRKVFEQFKKK